PLSPNEVIALLRLIAKAYVHLMPGASADVDALFDTIDELEQTHREEVSAIVNRIYAGLREVVNGGKVDAPTAEKVYDIIKRQSAELAEVAKKATNDVLRPVLEQHSELKENLGGRWTDIQQTYQSLRETDVSQQAQRIYSDTSAQLIGQGTPRQKSKQISELELYEKGQEEYLKDAPDRLKKFFSDEETVNNLLSGGGGTDAITAVWNKVKEVEARGKWDDESVQEVERFVHQKIEETKKEEGVQFEAHGSSAQGWLGRVPGVEKVATLDENRPLIALSIATSKSEDAKSLVEKTYSEGLSLLKGDGEKA
ncbi:hypothetical protein FRC01_000821, partial [Tulasnella sp. 417]